MNIWALIASIVLLILAVILIVVVLLQEGHQANLSGAIAGGADSFLGKNKGRTVDAFLSKWTKFFAIAFFVVALACDLLMYLK